ncbi:MAG: hypothetical protein JWQ75_2364 [Pseudarthrobacter sp.]|nr:hypothetical protein [Pseudarthrobacter sp.]
MTDGLGEWDQEPHTAGNQVTAPELPNPETGHEDEDPEGTAPAEPDLFYPDLVSFVHNKLAPTYRRNMGGSDTTWCPSWWKHAEAISRLEALWRAWEFLRLDPATGMSVWWRDHADHHMGVLLSSDGPFKGCSPKDGHDNRLAPLVCELPPPGLF